MERKRREFDAFLAMNAKKAAPSGRAVAHLQYRGESAHPSAPLLTWERDDVLSELDTNESTVRWLLHQMTTYDCATQKIVGLIFEDGSVLSDVLWAVRRQDA